MGSKYDPLQIMAPFLNNVKLIYRDLCRMKMEWDNEVPETIQEGIIKALSYFFQWKVFNSQENQYLWKQNKLSLRFSLMAVNSVYEYLLYCRMCYQTMKI